MIALKKLLAQMVLAADESSTWSDKAYFIAMSITKIAPVAFVLSGLDMWFTDNKMFFTFIVYALLANLIFGVWRHRKEGSFSWEKFFEKNFQMWLILILTYPLLEMMHIVTGDNIVSDVFTVIIQLATLLYPGSKVLKNVYIISNRQFPPKFIMERLYRFEKTGNPDVLFNKENSELTDKEKEEYDEYMKK